jgi:hypothetical protein
LIEAQGDAVEVWDLKVGGEEGREVGTVIRVLTLIKEGQVEGMDVEEEWRWYQRLEESRSFNSRRQTSGKAKISELDGLHADATERVKGEGVAGVKEAVVLKGGEGWVRDESDKEGAVEGKRFADIGEGEGAELGEK